MILLFGIPGAAILMGAITLFVAFSGPDQELPASEMPLSKSSWQATDTPP
jgi:hypothetical protein